MEVLTTQLHDEKRQGEVYAPETGMPGPVSKKFYIESYGCEMNFADSEIVASILNDSGFYGQHNVYRSRPGVVQYLFHPGKSRTNHPQPAASIPAGQTFQSRYC